MNAAKNGKLPLINLVAAWLSAREGQTPLSRDRVLGLIFCGDVRVNDERCRDPKRLFPGDVRLEIKGFAPAEVGVMDSRPPLAGGAFLADVVATVPPKPFVSRGGKKLESALLAWNVAIAGRVWLDAGCSTGGFSHCLLLHGARLVHAVDVGYNLLDWRLRILTAVHVMERTNIMGLELLDPPAEAAVADLSFRSMQGAAAKILSLTSANELYALIKPQFERKYRRGEPETPEPEAGEAFDGVVDDRETQAILEDVVRRLAGENIVMEKITPAGLRGRSGNQEYIALLRRGVADVTASRQLIAALFTADFAG